MTTISAALWTSRLPEITFLSPSTSHRRRRLHLAVNFELERISVHRSWRILAAKNEEGAALVEEKEYEYFAKLNGSSNGSSNGSYGFNGSVMEEYTNGSAGVIESESESGSGSVNGSLVKYVNGNGNGGVVSGEELVELKVETEKKKKSVEEIGQEEAWFKQSGGEQIEVYYIYMCFFDLTVYIVICEVHLSNGI